MNDRDLRHLTTPKSVVSRRLCEPAWKGSLPVRFVKIFKAIDVQQQIAADPRVFGVYDVTGDYDSMVLARVRGRKDLDDLTKTVFTLKGVQRSFTQVVLNTVKEDGRVVPPSE